MYEVYEAAMSDGNWKITLSAVNTQLNENDEYMYSHYTTGAQMSGTVLVEYLRSVASDIERFIEATHVDPEAARLA